MEFICSICVIRKDAPSANVLGSASSPVAREPVVAGVPAPEEPFVPMSSSTRWARTKVERRKRCGKRPEACEQRCVTLLRALRSAVRTRTGMGHFDRALKLSTSRAQLAEANTQRHALLQSTSWR